MRSLAPYLRRPSTFLLLVFIAFLFVFSASTLYAQTAVDQPTVQRQGTSPDILGGHETQPGAYPWQVALVHSDDSNVYEGFFCGGTLIDPQWVMTAAHCVAHQDPTVQDVVVGRHQLSTDEGERISVTQAIVHPSYYSVLDGSDVALLHLSHPATQTTLPLDRENELPIELRSLKATVTGWGVTETGYDASDVLREVAVPLIAHDICNDVNAYWGSVQADMVCAGYQKGGKDSCYGDSGGPLMVPTQEAPGWMQVGIVSWGDGCGEPNGYGVYTRVATYRGWVEGCITDPAGSVCTGGDSYEPDNSSQTATLLDFQSASQHHTLHQSQDVDWFKFKAQAGVTYLIKTEELGINSDTILWLLDQDGVTALAYNDDLLGYVPYGEASTRQSQLLWQAPTSGIYYLQVDNHWLYSSALTDYTIKIEEMTSQWYLPVIAN